MKDEQDHSSSKEIYRLPRVPFSQMDLRSLVSVRPFVGNVLISIAREAEVSELQIEVFVQQHVIRLQVSMRNSLFMKVLQGIHELMEVVSRHLLRQRSCLRDVVEDFSILCEFKNKAENVFR